MENNLTLKKVVLVWNRNADLLRLVRATFDSKVEANFDNSEKFANKKFAIFCFICLSFFVDI